MEQYIDLLTHIVADGHDTPLSRDNMPSTKLLPNQTMEFDMHKGIPLLTTKEVHIPSVIAETLWILRGDQNIKYLLDNKCNVWNPNAYKWYLEKMEGLNGLTPVSMKVMIRAIKDGCEFVANSVKGELIFIKNGEMYLCDEDSYLAGESKVPAVTSVNGITQAECYTYYLIAAQVLIDKEYRLGDMGAIYGPQLRNWNGNVDQFLNLIGRLQRNPYGRYAKVVLWNPEDMPDPELCGQPNCHGDFQVTCYPVAGKVYFELMMIQRSCDFFLGVPFNLMQYTIIGKIIEELTGYIFTKFKWVGANVHVYTNHLDAINEQLENEPLEYKGITHELFLIKKLKTVDDIESLEVSDFEIIDNHGNYEYHNAGKIKAPLCVGLKTI